MPEEAEFEERPRAYRRRYCIEDWDKPIPIPTLVTRQRKTHNVSAVEGNWGYTDDVIIVSVLRDENGEVESVGFFDSVSLCGRPPRELMEKLRDQVIHYLEHHCP